jgi:hypothetical protein
MGLTSVSRILSASAFAALVLWLELAPAFGQIAQTGDRLWVTSGASIELEGPDKQLYDAPAGSLLIVQKISQETGRNGTFWVATVQDVHGRTYRTLASNFTGKVVVDPVSSAVQMPSNVAQASSTILGGASSPSCPPGIQEFRPWGPGDSADLSVPSASGSEAPPSTVKVDAADCVSTKKHPTCKKTPCNLEPPPDAAMRRFYPMIVEAMNGANLQAANARARARGLSEIHPAMIASIIAAESSGNPIVTFTEKSGRKGKGIGQYTYFEKAWGANLDYNAKKPTEDTVFGTKVNTPYELTHKGTTRRVYSVWSPKGVILGMAADLSRILAEDRFITPRGKTGAPIPGAAPVEVSKIYKVNSTQAMRYLAGHHNRQDRVFQSIEEFYRQEKRLPAEYGETWGTPPTKSTPKYGLLYGQCINRCYVEKIAGLCGQASGFFARYQGHFLRAADGRWIVA